MSAIHGAAKANRSTARILPAFAKNHRDIFLHGQSRLTTIIITCCLRSIRGRWQRPVPATRKFKPTIFASYLPRIQLTVCRFQSRRDTTVLALRCLSATSTVSSSIAARTPGVLRHVFDRTLIPQSKRRTSITSGRFRRTTSGVAGTIPRPPTLTKLQSGSSTFFTPSPCSTLSPTMMLCRLTCVRS